MKNVNFEIVFSKCFLKDLNFINYLIALQTEFNIMNEKLDVFSKEIYEISMKEFSINNFERLINNIRNHVSEVIQFG